MCEVLADGLVGKVAICLFKGGRALDGRDISDLDSSVELSRIVSLLSCVGGTVSSD